MKIAVIGSGVSGIAAAKTLKQLGHDVVILDKAPAIGGVWSVAYPGVHLQSSADLYAFSDFPWPADHEEYPSAAAILAYLKSAIAHFGLDVRLNVAVRALTQSEGGWRAELTDNGIERSEDFDAIVVATGHYTGEKTPVDLPGQETFGGKILTEHEIGDLTVFDGKRVAVIGFGKSALDVLSFALGHAAKLHHVFRTARWLLPRRIFGKPIASVTAARISAVYSSSWVYPRRLFALMHKISPWAATINDAVTSLFVKQALGISKPFAPADVKRRLATISPDYAVARQLRGTLAPEAYIPAVASGRIEPHQSAQSRLTTDSLQLADGTLLPIDIVVIAAGYKRPVPSFLPESVKAQFEASGDGLQLYRHILHPELPRLGFVGFNHNPLHIPSGEISTLWLDAVWRGDLTPPPPATMAKSAASIANWKRANTIFEPTRAYWVSNHMHNYLDVLLTEIGIRRRRKGIWVIDEYAPYVAADYKSAVDEYKKTIGRQKTLLPLDT